MEWIALDTVVSQVCSDYLKAQEWLQDSALKDWVHRWTYAPLYLSGGYLRRYQQELRRERRQGAPDCTGVLRVAHQVTARHFSEDGERCLVIDHQTQRRMATYSTRSRERLHTQDVGECAMVYQMIYDARNRRWKIDSFVQQLPSGWDNPKLSQRIVLQAHLPAAKRDH